MRCTHTSITSGFLRTLLSSPAICDSEKEAASVVQTGKTGTESTTRSFQEAGSSTDHGKNKAKPRSPSPTDIGDDYFQVVRHPGMYALRMHSWNRRQPAVGNPGPVEAAPGADVQLYVTNELDGEDAKDSNWDKLSDMLDDPIPEQQQGN